MSGVTKYVSKPVRKRGIKNTCLKCDRKFVAVSIYNRICPHCAESNADIHFIRRREFAGGGPRIEGD